ncbi:MAG TPA: type I-U CRISPR-associated protein Csb2 [Acidobacteriota bacterium]|nr:type I-U CRISPR-associated protein Csb2 [Acidobacteriota bacterium]
MLAFGIRYLNGFVAAAEPDDLQRAEWPPHPGRIYMALAAAHFQTGADPVERSALLWLEGTTRGGEISAPALIASNAAQRASVSHYVPVNDKAGPSQALMHSLPLTRERQERVFARAWPDEDRIYLYWADLEPPPGYRETLANLCAKVTRIGHSSSLVQMWVAEAGELGEPSWLPDDERAVISLRIPGPGTLEYLEQQYNQAAIEDYAELRVTELDAADSKTRQHAATLRRERYGNQPPPQQRPRLSLWQGYARPALEPSSHGLLNTLFSPHFLPLQLKPQTSSVAMLDLVAAPTLVRRWRDAILSHSNGLSEPVRQVLSGHEAGGGPAADPHLAFLPLAFVGHEHADAHLLGMGLVLPGGLSREQRREALRAVAAVRELKLGPLGVWQLTAVTASQPAWNLRPETWTAYPSGATHWSTVTPIAFDRHSKAKSRTDREREEAAMIAAACERAGLPRPRAVIITHVSAHTGVPPSFVFPHLRRKDGGRRRHTHAILVFEQPVCGPMLVGAGRFRGYGVCRPILSDIV